MSDLDDLFADVFMDIWPSNLPAIPAKTGRRGNEQAVDNADNSRTSRTSRDKIELTDSGASQADRDRDFSEPSGSRATSSYQKSAGSAGSAGRGGEILAESTSSLFPQKIEEVGSAGREVLPTSCPILDLNRAEPQHSDWWTGPLMAEVDAAALPISPEQVRAGVERELRALADLGRDGPDALRDAIEITRAKIWNSEALAERQVHDGRCHDCGDPLDDDAPMVAILSAARGKHLFMHSGCHAEHIRRREALVDKIMVAAGYGADRQDGVSA